MIALYPMACSSCIWSCTPMKWVLLLSDGPTLPSALGRFPAYRTGYVEPFQREFSVVLNAFRSLVSSVLMVWQ